MDRLVTLLRRAGYVVRTYSTGDELLARRPMSIADLVRMAADLGIAAAGTVR